MVIIIASAVILLGGGLLLTGKALSKAGEQMKHEKW